MYRNCKLLGHAMIRLIDQV